MLILSLFVFSFSSFAGIEVSPEDMAILKSGKFVKRVKMIEGKIWPEVTIISIIPHTPKENVDVYSDFNSHSKFVPDLIKSHVSKVEDGASYIDAEMKMPWPIKNSIYTTKSISKIVGDAYELSWVFVSGNQLKDTVGVVHFVPFEGGKTLFSYTNHVTPDSSLASIFRDRVPLDVEKAVTAILKHLKKNAGKK